MIPGGDHINSQYQRFNRELPLLCRRLKLKKSELTFNDFTNIVTSWLAA